ncbi:AbrB/MazE/SpoVT family DNA-binding domain-containing protein [Candidatus Woesearchaeota archaeon]|nr:AbrB/MazE/SpoVT family DNA-binding domain-containing protein [Candidatus Woesearchaeota archaeon]
MEYAIAKVSTKGQIVIPSSLRDDVETGDEFLMIRDDGKIILKSMKSLAASLRDDLAFADAVEKAWQEHDKGRFKRSSKEDFLKELHAC